MQSEITTISPEQAESMLTWSKEAGGLNRLKRSRINKLQREMENGRWILNGQPIILEVSGKIQDGHHRLTACVHAKVPFRTLLVTEAEPKALSTIDLGATRNIAETLHLNGHQGKLGPLGAVGKAAAWIINNELHGGPLRELPQAYMVEEWLSKHRELEEPCMTWVERIGAAFEGIQVPKVIVAYAFLQGMLNGHREATEEFLLKFSTGYNITDGDAAGVLRNFFLVDFTRLMHSKNGKRKPTTYTILGRCLKCLRASIDNEKLPVKLTFNAKDTLPDMRPAATHNHTQEPLFTTEETVKK